MEFGNEMLDGAERQCPFCFILVVKVLNVCGKTFQESDR